MDFLADSPDNTLGSYSRLNEIVQYPAAVLNSKAAPVTEFNAELQQLIEKMMLIMYSCNGIGLAAPQINVLKQVFVIADPRSDANQGIALVNPEIIEASDELSVMPEECLSLIGLQVPVARPDEITIKGYDYHGNEHRHHLQGVLAHIFAHEYDHLQGKLIIDYLDKSEKRKAIEILRATEA